MIRRRINQLLLLAGLAMMVAVLTVTGLGLPAPRAQAHELPPRPTLVPLPPEDPEDDKDESAAVGRITGTVIDLATGAPAPGVAVAVGDKVVQTDANGNYDLNGLPAGTYQVALVMTAGQGEAAQAPLSLSLSPGAVLVQHLAYHAPAPMPAPAASPVPEQVPVPQTLPNAGAAAGAGAPWPLLGLALAALTGGAALRRGTQRKGR